MSDIRLLFSEALDTRLYAFRLFPAVAGILAALALYSRLKNRLAKKPPSSVRRLPAAALPLAGITGGLLIVVRAAGIAPALDSYLSVAGGLLLAIALAALFALRTARKDPVAAAAATAAALIGAGTFVLAVGVMHGLMQLPLLKEPVVSFFGIAAPAGLTALLGGWPVVRRACRGRALPAWILAAGALAGGAMAAAGVILAIIGVPKQLPPVAIVAMTAFPLAAVAGLKAASHVPLKIYAVLFGLRMLIVAGLVVFLGRPALSIQTQRTEKPTLAFLIDTSASMGARDGESTSTRLDWVRQSLRPRFLNRLEEDFNLAWFAFSGAARQVHRIDLPDLKPDGETTNLAMAVAAAKAAAPASDLAAAVMISDGIDNSGGRDPAAVIADEAVPVHTVSVGALSDSRQTRDIAVTDVETPRYATVHNVCEIRVHLQSTGIYGPTDLILKRGGKELAAERLELKPGRKTHVQTLRFTPDKLGRYDFEVTIPPAPEERIDQNNSYQFSIIVSDPKIRVLYIEGALRWEYKFIKRTLDMDPNIELLARVQTRKDVFLKQEGAAGKQSELFPTTIDELRTFDVIILGDIDSTFFSRQQLDLIEQAVKEGAGLLMIGGEASFGPGGYATTPIADLLPVKLGGRGDKQFKQPFLLQLTDEGMAHPIFRGTLDFFQNRTEREGVVMPRLAGSTEVLGRKPAATVLAVNPDKTGQDGQPLIIVAVQQYGTGRTMALTADTTWQWYFLPKGIGQETPYVKFWGQAIRWLANEEVKEREQKPGITFFTDKRTYSPAEEVRLFGRARGEGGLATNTAAINAVVTAPSGTTTALAVSYVPGTAGEYEARFEPPEPGLYSVVAKATLDNKPLGEPVKLDFRVGSPNLEFDRLDVDEDLLKRIAARTGGKYYSLIRLDDLVNNLQAVEHSKRGRREVSLWDYIVMPVVNLTSGVPVLHTILASLAPDPQGIFLAFLLLVAVEWTIRKRRMLS